MPPAELGSQGRRLDEHLLGLRGWAENIMSSHPFERHSGAGRISRVLWRTGAGKGPEESRTRAEGRVPVSS